MYTDAVERERPGIAPKDKQAGEGRRGVTRIPSPEARRPALASVSTMSDLRPWRRSSAARKDGSVRSPDGRRYSSLTGSPLANGDARHK